MEKKLLLVAEDSNWLVERADGNQFLMKEGNQTDLVNNYTQLLRDIEFNFKHMHVCCKQLDELELLKPFAVKVKERLRAHRAS